MRYPGILACLHSRATVPSSLWCPIGLCEYQHEGVGLSKGWRKKASLGLSSRPSFRIVLKGGAIAMIAELRGGMAVAYHMHFTHIVVTTLPFLIEQCSVYYYITCRCAQLLMY